MRELQGRMRHLQAQLGPPCGPDGRPLGPPMMMGPNGPMPRPPPNHPLMMEMAALDKHLRGLYQQPQNADTQAQVGASTASENSCFVCFFSNISLLLQIFNRLGLMADKYWKT